MSAIGQHLVESLVRNGAREIVVTSRKMVNCKAFDRILRTYQSKCKISTYVLDVTNEASIESLFSTLVGGFSCVFFLAGIFQVSSVVDLDIADLFDVVAVKRAASGIYHHLCHRGSLPALFLTISSVTVLGMEGSGAYATANGELEWLAINGEKCVSLRLGPVDMENSMANQTAKAFFLKRGCLSLSIDSVIQKIEGIIACARAEKLLPSVISLLNVDIPLWNKCRAWDTSFQGFERKLDLKTLNTPTTERSNGVTIDGSDEIGKIRSILRKSLQINASGRIEENTPFENLGLYSIVGSTFAGLLTNAFKVIVSPDDLYHHNDLRKLANFLSSRQDEDGGSASNSRAKPSLRKPIGQDNVLDIVQPLRKANLGEDVYIASSTNMTLKERIHPTASIDPSAKIAENVVVGPYTIIGPGVIIESDCSIKPHCVVEAGVRIGKACVIGHHVYLGAYTELGVNCILKQNIIITGRARLGNHVHIFSGACIGEAGEANSRPVAIGVVTVGNYVTLREGVIIHSPTDTSSTTVGNNSYLMHGVHVAHDCHIGERVTVGPHAVFAGFCDVQYGAWIGLNSTFHQQTTVGAYAMVGMSTRVTRDVPPFCTFVDNVCVKLNSFGLTKVHKIAQRDVDLVMQYFQYAWPDLPRETTWFSHVIRRFFSTRKEKAAGRSLGPIIFGKYDTETNKQSKTKLNCYTLRQSILTILCKTLHLPTSQNIQDDTPFEYLGLDSIVGGRFASSLSNRFKVEISADDIYKHDNLRSLCEYINLKMNGVEVPGNAVSTKEVQLPDNHLNSVEDIKSILKKTLTT